MPTRQKIISEGISLFTILLICSFAGATVLIGAEETMILVKAGQPEAEIILGEKPTKVAQFAAMELQHHIKLMTGASLLIRQNDDSDMIKIYVGDSKAVARRGVNYTDFRKQEYMIKFLPKALVLAGKDKQDFGKPVYNYLHKVNAVNSWPSIFCARGTMDAVYDFLEKYCGVKWINPTDFGTIIPERKTLAILKKDERRVPSMLFRGGSSGTDRSEIYQLNGGLWKKGAKEGDKYNKLAYADLSAKTENLSQLKVGIRAQNRLFMYRRKAGGEESKCNHSFYNYYERFWKKTNNNFEGSRPEYFAKGYEGDKPPQLCYGNDATVKQVVKDAQDYFTNGGYTKVMSGIGTPGPQWGENFFALEPMDSTAFCKCPECSRQYEPNRKDDQSEHSTYWFRFVNKVAKEIKKSHPDKKISTLAYMSHEGLPTGFKMEDNVVVHFCISNNRMPYNKVALKKQMDRLNEWDQQENVPMYLWLYNTFPLEIANYGNFFCFPGFFAHTQKWQYEMFDKLDIKGVFHCGFNGEVDNYVAYRLMDDPAQDVDTILDDYFSSYGVAGEPLKKMYELIEERYSNIENYPKKSSGAPYTGHQTVGAAWGYLGNAETMDKLQIYMDHAYKLAETEYEKSLVELWDKALWAYMKAGRARYVERMNSPIPAINAPRVATANGVVGKVDWSKAAILGSDWYKCGSKDPGSLKLNGKICHDNRYLYMELIDFTDPKKLVVAPNIACYDDWEIVVAGQMAQPFRQYMIGPTAMTEGLSYGEVNWRQGVKSTEYTTKAFGIKAVSDTKGDKWVVRLAFPLANILERPIKPGDDIYMNIMRVMSPQLAKGSGKFGLDTWVPYTTVKDVDRLAKIHLEK